MPTNTEAGGHTMQPSGSGHRSNTFSSILCLTVRGVEPDVTHQTSWLRSTGEYNTQRDAE